MAKKETKVAPAAPAAGQTQGEKLGAAAKQRAMKAQNDVFTATGNEVAAGTKIAPQAQVIVNTIKAAGKKGVSRSTLVDNLKGVLVTRQPEGRILSYYQKELVEAGLITIAPAA